MSRDGVPGYASGPDAPLAATAQALERAGPARCVVLVEGLSDQIAVETLATRLGHDLAADGVVVVPIGGAQALGRYLTRFASKRIVGLCDAAESTYVQRALAASGRAGPGSRPGLEAAGFFVCDADLEDELIRAAGPGLIERVLTENGDRAAFQSLCHQPAWRGRPFEAQMRRFLGAGSRRKLRYAQLLVSSVAQERFPPPLLGVLEAARG